MATACFDPDGFPLWVARGAMRPGVPAGATLVEVAGDVGTADLYMDPVSTTVMTPQAATIAVDRTLVIAGDGGAKLTLPDPCWVLVDGIRRRVLGGLLVIAPPAGAAVRVELAGKHRGPPVTIVAQTLASAEAVLLAQVDADRETQQMAVLTVGGAKKYVYNRKAAEALDSRALLVTVLNALNLSDRQKRFPFASDEAALTGEPLSVVLARYDTAMTASSIRIAKIEAQAQRAKRAIRAATTLAAKQAAADVRWTS